MKTLGELFATLPPPRYLDCSSETPVAGLCVDSRRIEPGQVFLALRGETVDAHRFVPAVIEAGAAAAVVADDAADSLEGPRVVVPDPSEAYPELAANAFDRPATRLRLTGITGTNGKTTTAHLFASILGGAKLAHTRLGTTGNWLVDKEESAGFTTPFPLELQSLLFETVSRGGTHAVMEVSSHALAQGRVKPLKFDAVGFTSFSQDHLDFHPDMESYLAAKCLLASQHLAEGGTAVAAVDDQPAALKFLEVARANGGTAWAASRSDPGADISASEIRYLATHTEARLQTPAGVLELWTPLLAGYNLDNAMVAVGLALAIGIDLDAIGQALRGATGAPGRLERVSLDGLTGPSVVVDYAHTPDAVLRAIAAVRAICRGKLHVVLGCGGDRDPGKRPLMGSAASRGADVFWATSDNPRTEDPELIVDGMLSGVATGDRAEVHREVDRAKAIAAAIAAATANDAVLIAGKGHEDYQILGVEKIRFDDREHAAEALRRWSKN